MKIKDWMVLWINCKKESSVLKTRATQLNNMADEITLRLLKLLIVFLISTWNQLSSMYLVRVKPSKDVYVTTDDIGACHRIGKSNRNSKKTIVCLINRKHCKCALVDRKKPKSFNSD